MNDQNLKDFIKDRYGKIARGEVKFCCPTCGPTTTDQCLAMGYTAEDLRLVPEMAILGVGCGNPTALADLTEGETVLDLGSGAGIYVFLAAKTPAAARWRLCDQAQGQCHFFPGETKIMHVGFPDPARAAGTEEEIMAAFRQVRDDLREKLISLLKEKVAES